MSAAGTDTTHLVLMPLPYPFLGHLPESLDRLLQLGIVDVGVKYEAKAAGFRVHRLILYTSLKLLTEAGSSLRPAESKGEDEGSGWTYHFLSESRITSVRLV